MNRKMKTIIALLGLFALFSGISCDTSSITLTTNKPGDSGVYKSEDKGNHWAQKIFVERVKKKDTTIGGVNVKRFVVDPDDSRILYILTNESGVWKTVDGAEQWRQIYPGGGVGDLSIDGKNHNNLFIASGNTIARSDDAGSTWIKAYLESRPGLSVNSVVIDRSDARRVYAGTSAGDVLVTKDTGASWQVLYRFDGVPLIRMLQIPSRLLFAATPNQGLWRSSDEGATWTNTSESLKDKPGANDIRDIVSDPGVPNGLFLITNYGIFRTRDGGETWNEVTLIARPGGADIKSMAVSPVNSQELYYAVPGGLYRSSDGGRRWATLALPVGNVPSAMVIDWYNPDIIYSGFTKVKK